MNHGLKIAGIVFFLWIGLTAKSQVEHGLISFSNKLLINPSYAGFNRDTHISSSLLFNARPEKNLNNNFSLTYDTWSKKMQGGVSLRFHQGLIGKQNTNITGAGFAFTKPFDLAKRRQFIPSFSLNLHTATKQWFVHLIDRTIDKSFEHQSPPGEEFLRFAAVQPGVGLLWNSPAVEIGAAATYSFYQELGEEPDELSRFPLSVVFHAAKKKRGKRNGLISQPVKASPEAVVIFSENVFMSRVGLRLERVDHQLGIFAQNDFMWNSHGIGGAYSWKLNNLRLHLSAGTTYSVPHKKAAFFGEAGLGLIIPYIQINDKNPWAPPPRSF